MKALNALYVLCLYAKYANILVEKRTLVVKSKIWNLMDSLDTRERGYDNSANGINFTIRKVNLMFVFIVVVWIFFFNKYMIQNPVHLLVWVYRERCVHILYAFWAYYTVSVLILHRDIYQVEGTVLVPVHMFVNKENTYRLKRWNVWNTCKAVNCFSNTARVKYLMVTFHIYLHPHAI